MVPHPNQVVSLSEIKRTLGYKVLVRRDSPQKVTGLGIVLPGDGKKSQMATVLAIGEGRVMRKTGRRVPLQVKVGDRVLIGTDGGYSCHVENEQGEIEELFILREDGMVDEILAIIETD